MGEQARPQEEEEHQEQELEEEEGETGGSLEQGGSLTRP